jgi:hypothetical protein
MLYCLHVFVDCSNNKRFLNPDNLPICAHAVSDCAEQQQILKQAGADLKHYYFSHVEATFGWSGRNVNE